MIDFSKDELITMGDALEVAYLSLYSDMALCVSTRERFIGMSTGGVLEVRGETINTIIERQLKNIQKQKSNIDNVNALINKINNYLLEE